MGPVTAVRKGSPAEEAGFLPGDQILQVNGQPVGDPLSLAQRLAAEAGKPEPMTFVVSRQARDNTQAQRTLSVRPELPLQFSSRFPTGGPAGIECVGVAFDVLPIVESVAAGSPAEKAGLMPGDTIIRAQFVPAGEVQRNREKMLLSNDAFEPIVLDDRMKTWTLLFTLMQKTLPDTELQLTWKRGTEEQMARLTPVDSTTFFDESRGLELYAQSRIHRAAGVMDALRLGFRETKERVREVLLILQSLITRRLSATNLSGPAGIIFAAGSFASEGPAKLLIFLTILSANLAVLNFLPIPALDGGHMLFLAAEWIRGKPVDERLQIRLTIAGVLCLLTLMVFATAMDIGRFAEMIQQLF
jgi:regulator of sigma E protease